jgi:hypothetical protein
MGLMFLKMNMEKAFDKMEWPFILAIMKKMGFHPTWISWIETCISFFSFSILINGNSFGLLFPERCLRQGDPLSPFMFILRSKVLSRLLYREEHLDNIRGLKIAINNPTIHHLLFIDDLLIFGKASLTEACSFKLCLDKYCLWSRQQEYQLHLFFKYPKYLPFHNQPPKLHLSWPSHHDWQI